MKTYTAAYHSPVGPIVLESDGEALTTYYVMIDFPF